MPPMNPMMLHRILVMKGSVIMMWKMLTPAVFDYKASCDASGHTILDHLNSEMKPSPKGKELMSSKKNSSDKEGLRGTC